MNLLSAGKPPKPQENVCVCDKCQTCRFCEFFLISTVFLRFGLKQNTQDLNDDISNTLETKD